MRGRAEKMVVMVVEFLMAVTAAAVVKEVALLAAHCGPD